jgi:3-oxoacyl-(acyl-carrier-protein) synthase
VVTAVEATTALGADIDSTWKGLLAGESGIRVLEDDFVTKWDLPVRIGGHLVDPIDDHMGRLDLRRMSYVQRMSKFLGRRMWDAAGAPEVDPDRFSVVIGTGLGGGEKIVETYVSRKTIEKYSHAATFDEIKENDFNLNIPRYVDTFEAEAVVDIAKVQQEILDLEKKQAELRVKMNLYLKELGLDV